MLPHQIAFDFRDPGASLELLPSKPGVFALFGVDPHAEPYLSRTTNLRRRISRFLNARPGQTRRLQLSEKVVRIEYTATGSDLESTLVLYSASFHAFGERARKRLRLAPPAFIRFAAANPYPRAYVTTRLARGAADHLYGPFPSRLSAERYLDEALNLFLLRRCTFELNPDPSFPGCVYSEMKMCLAPCFKGCSDERYKQEAGSVQSFFATRGASLLEGLAVDRNAASEAMEFERAATLHARIQKVEGVAALAAEVVRPLAKLRATLVMPAAEPFHVALFSLEGGLLAGPMLYSVAGMRHPNEQSGSTSLYAQPFALEPVPLQAEAVVSAPASASDSAAQFDFVRPVSSEQLADAADAAQPKSETAEIAAPIASKRMQWQARGLLESRLDEALATLKAIPTHSADSQTTADHLCIFKRWYYRPAAHRIGEIVFAQPDSGVPAKAILRAISRVFRGATASP